MFFSLMFTVKMILVKNSIMYVFYSLDNYNYDYFITLETSHHIFKYNSNLLRVLLLSVFLLWVVWYFHSIAPVLQDKNFENMVLLRYKF